MNETILSMWTESAPNFICLTGVLFFLSIMFVDAVFKGLIGMIHGWPPDEDEED